MTHLVLPGVVFLGLSGILTAALYSLHRFTFPALALGKRVVVLVAGEEKADAVAAAFGESAKPDPHVPSSLLASVASDLVVLLDSAAASGL